MAARRKTKTKKTAKKKARKRAPRKKKVSRKKKPRRFSVDEKATILDELERFEGSQKDFARKKGIDTSLLANWKKLRRDGKIPGPVQLDAQPVDEASEEPGEDDERTAAIRRVAKGQGREAGLLEALHYNAMQLVMNGKHDGLWLGKPTCEALVVALETYLIEKHNIYPQRRGFERLDMSPEWRIKAE